jgi:hypothetical protein
MRQVLGIAVFSGMLGVTLFGIFLTPVFFYVIEGFVETPLFSSERARLLGRVLGYVLGVLTLGLPWLLPLLLGKGARPTSASAPEQPAAPAPGPVEALVTEVGPIPGGADSSTNGHQTVSDGQAEAPGTTPRPEGPAGVLQQ